MVARHSPHPIVTSFIHQTARHLIHLPSHSPSRSSTLPPDASFFHPAMTPRSSTRRLVLPPGHPTPRSSTQCLVLPPGHPTSRSSTRPLVTSFSCHTTLLRFPSYP
ncbi:hypothetical protein Pcinc_020718 [Petrolisthes cinctipes]|uniref:Uncharacterized protein n=1 Tax=Petrolisthes cinctipes TaxID=88211 RepID=A0AAE1KL05_PETCI|nr:hypothetical protein Pcinc_020718 [Petrolisthes cinctipes]